MSDLYIACAVFAATATFVLIAFMWFEWHRGMDGPKHTLRDASTAAWVQLSDARPEHVWTRCSTTYDQGGSWCWECRFVTTANKKQKSATVRLNENLQLVYLS